MAQKITYDLVDDLDGGKAVETLTFSIDDQTYEIDLGKRNADRLRAAFAPYVEAGRRMVHTRGRGRSKFRSDRICCRVWARCRVRF